MEKLSKEELIKLMDECDPKDVGKHPDYFTRVKNALDSQPVFDYALATYYPDIAKEAMRILWSENFLTHPTEDALVSGVMTEEDLALRLCCHTGRNIHLVAKRPLTTWMFAVKRALGLVDMRKIGLTPNTTRT